MSHELLSNIWFFGLALVWAIYVVQDGFITGGSMLSFLYKDDEEVYQKSNSILALHWDGIQVWLILAVGGMFAAFPKVYATTLSELYVPFFLLLYMLILRGVSIEVLYKTNSEKVRMRLKWALTISSFLITLIVGVYLLNTFIGLPIGPEGYNTGFFAFLSLFNGTALLGGIMFVAFAMVQGVSYLRLNTDKEFIPVMYEKAKYASIVFPFLMAAIFLSFANVLDVFARGPFGAEGNAVLWLVPVVAIIASALGTILFIKQKHGLSFIANVIGMITFIFTGFISMMPYAIVSTVDSSLGLTIVDGAAGQTTLMVMFVALLIFLPIVIGYQAFKYIRFWGRV